MDILATHPLGGYILSLMGAIIVALLGALVCIGRKILESIFQTNRRFEEILATYDHRLTRVETKVEHMEADVIRFRDKLRE